MGWPCATGCGASIINGVWLRRVCALCVSAGCGVVHGHHGGLPYSGHFIVRRGLLVVGHGSGGLCDACASICLFVSIGQRAHPYGTAIQGIESQ